jgi:N-acetylmuramoyl-L-alanine amidase
MATDTVGVSDSTTININIADTPPTVTIDGPDEGSTVAGTITVSGWALDNVNETGVAITSVNVLVDGSVVGKASYGVSRPDVCAIWPGRPGCPNVGYVYSLNTATLSPGSHTISVSAVNALSITGTAHVTVTVGYSSPTVQIDSPTSGSVVSGKITVSGWAIDSTTTIGTAISSVKILVDGNTVGTATYGVKRTDVCVLWPGRPGCPNVGYSYSLNTAGLSAGSHILTVTATNSGPNPTTGWSSAAFTIGSGQTLTLNSPTAGSVVNGMITVSGWTQHLASRRMNSPINITVDGNLVGTASSDNSRPDGCRLHHSKLSEAVSDAAAQADCAASGFVYLLDTQNLTPGLHLLTVSTAGTDGTSDANSWTVDFTVPEPGGNL